MPITSAKITEDKKEIIQWIKKNTDSEEAILCSSGLSVEVLAYCNRPIIIHNYFEAKDIRDKTEDCINAFYKTEQEFYKMCWKYDISYVIYHWGFLLSNGINSDRYLVNAFIVSKDSVSYLFNFRPDKIKNFRLVYQNSNYRIFKVIEKNKKEEKSLHPIITYSSFFNEKLFIYQDNQSNFVDDNYNNEIMRRLCRIIPQGLNQAKIYCQKKQFDKALGIFNKLVEIEPYSPMMRLEFGKCLALTKQYEKAIQQIKYAVKIEPTLTEGYQVLKVLYLDKSVGDNEK